MGGEKSHALPARHALFVGETYTLEVGYQLRALVAQMRAELASLLKSTGGGVVFKGAGEADLPYMEHAWSVEYPGDVRRRRRGTGHH